MAETKVVDEYDKVMGTLKGWWAGFIESLPNIGMALVVLGISFFIAFRLKKLAVRLMNKFSENRAVNRLIATVITFLICAAGLFIALGILGLDKTVTSLLAGAGVVGLAVGLAFQEPIINTISGVVLAVRKNIRLGELIESNDYLGTVKTINLRETIIETPQGQMVFIPNKEVIMSPLKNYTRYGHRRIDLECGISYGEKLPNVKELVEKAIGQIEYVEKDKIDFIYTGFGDSSINFTVRYWITETGQRDYLHARSEGIMNIKSVFDNNDILIPFPIRTLDFDAKGGKTLRSMLSTDNNGSQDTAPMQSSPESSSQSNSNE